MTRENKNMDKENKPTAISKLIEYLEEMKYQYKEFRPEDGILNNCIADAISLAKQVEYETANPTKQ